ncbi:MAG: AAA family ATPase [Cytophagaceae bacterium]
MKIGNPFFLSGYYGPDFFCDREEETSRLSSNALNGVNSTLLSIRRMGKTGLINHCFYHLNKSKKIKTIYVDIYASQNLRDMTNSVAAAIMQAFPDSNTVGKRLMNVIKNLRPTIGFDPLTGLPEVNFEYSRSTQYEKSLMSLFTFLEEQKTTTVIAIDEFQQISTYPEKNTEALLRTIIQPLQNVQFIFSGSNKHLLSEMFNDSKRPFFSSTQAVYLGQIDQEKYAEYIKTLFDRYKKAISKEAIEFILEFSKMHTYYTQVICNRLFASVENKIDLEITRKKCAEVLKEQEHIFFQYRNLLTSIQWSLLAAIAKEDKVYKPTSKKFLSEHNVGTAANVQRALDSLLNKEMIYKEIEEEGTYYRVYDCFLSRWLEQSKIN